MAGKTAYAAPAYLIETVLARRKQRALESAEREVNLERQALVPSESVAAAIVEGTDRTPRQERVSKSEW